ncbi:hypothetical protein [Paraburkholderia bannensis]|uniref:hypothetical protein n=1 Tax=Paraburkholderia bannensis TaxID=765414 RepID=UPI0012EB3642|nr:hypothetical protein [Paraburkholderia bannensis]
MEEEKLAAEVHRALSSDPEMYIAATRSNMERTALAASSKAAEYGHSISIKTAVYQNDGSYEWPTTLARMVCESPGLAHSKNAEIARILTGRLEMAKPFPVAKLSKPLSEAAKKMVRPILAEHGYETSDITTGTDIVRIVRNNVRSGAAVPQTITTKFYADRIELDGRSFQYRQRDRVPTGHAWHDLSLRLTIGVAGVDVPLAAVLKLRNIGIGEFIQADETAIANGTADEIARRRQINQVGRAHPTALRLVQGTIPSDGENVAAHARRTWATLAN